jgi:hypothetical protein
MYLELLCCPFLVITTDKFIGWCIKRQHNYRQGHQIWFPCVYFVQPILLSYSQIMRLSIHWIWTLMFNSNSAWFNRNVIQVLFTQLFNYSSLYFTEELVANIFLNILPFRVVMFAHTLHLKHLQERMLLCTCCLLRIACWRACFLKFALYVNLNR